MCLMSPGCPTDIVLQLGKACYPCRGGMFVFLFHSCLSFLPLLLFHILYYLVYLFPPFLSEMTQNDPEGLTVIKSQHNQSIKVTAHNYEYMSHNIPSDMCPTKSQISLPAYPCSLLRIFIVFMKKLRILGCPICSLFRF